MNRIATNGGKFIRLQSAKLGIAALLPLLASCELVDVALPPDISDPDGCYYPLSNTAAVKPAFVLLDGRVYDMSHNAPVGSFVIDNSGFYKRIMFDVAVNITQAEEGIFHVEITVVSQFEMPECLRYPVLGSAQCLSRKS